MRLLDVVSHVKTLTHDAPYAIVGGLAQILWARKTHTDDLDLLFASSVLQQALASIREDRAEVGWTLPVAPDESYESNEVFGVCHLLFKGSVVDLIAFADDSFNDEILATAQTIDDLDGLRFVAPELLLITHLLRPGSLGALAAIELILARRDKGGMDMEVVRAWARKLQCEPRLERALDYTEALDKT